jgi:signal transduction histidine kinase
VIFVVVYRNTGSELRAQVERDVASDTRQLTQALSAPAGSSAARVAAIARSYMRAQPFSATSTLLFALVPGAPTATNHPELLGSAGPESGETQAEQARENAFGRTLRTPHLGYSTQRVPDVGAVRILERSVPVGRLAVIVGAGQPLTTVERAQHGVARAFLLAGVLTLAIALVASYFLGARVSAPLRRMAAVATRVDAGDLEPRMETPPRRGEEVAVLAYAFNHMLDRLAEAFAGQREFVADASHELRTPLTVIRGQLEVLAAQENPSPDEVRRVERLVQGEISRISRLVDEMLLLAQTERADFLVVDQVDLRTFVTDLWNGVSLTAERRFELGPVPDGSLHTDPDRLAQALHNLARNAVEHTAPGNGLVRLEVARVAGDAIRFSVLDDGPGIPVEERDRIFERFHRTDRARNRSAGGAGLGLAIVRAIADASGGAVGAGDRRNGGGARIELTLPGFRPA